MLLDPALPCTSILPDSIVTRNASSGNVMGVVVFCVRIIKQPRGLRRAFIVYCYMYFLPQFTRLGFFYYNKNTAGMVPSRCEWERKYADSFDRNGEL